MQASAADHQLTTTTYATVGEGERAVRDKNVDVLLIDGTRLEWRSTSDSTLTAAIANALQAVHIREQADRLGITADQLRQLLVPMTLTSRTIGAAHTTDEDANTVGFIAVGALFMTISFYAGFVLTGVVQEKSNRVAEVLLARMPAREVLAGKVLGIGAVGLAQFALIAVAAGVTVRVMNHADAPNIPADVLAWTLVWFCLGYFFYSVVYATLGATTSRDRGRPGRHRAYNRHDDPRLPRGHLHRGEPGHLRRCPAVIPPADRTDGDDLPRRAPRRTRLATHQLGIAHGARDLGPHPRGRPHLQRRTAPVRRAGSTPRPLALNTARSASALVRSSSDSASSQPTARRLPRRLAGR